MNGRTCIENKEAEDKRTKKTYSQTLTSDVSSVTTKNSFRPGVDKYNRTVNSSEHKKIRSNRLSKGEKEIPSANSTFSGSTPIVAIYVGGCTTDSTTEGLKTYCEEQEITPHEIVELNTRSKWYKSLKFVLV